MKSWYYFRLPSGARVAYKGAHVGEALDELLARTGFRPDEVEPLGSEPILPPPTPQPDYERAKRGVALGLAALRGETI